MSENIPIELSLTPSEWCELANAVGGKALKALQVKRGDYGENDECDMMYFHYDFASHSKTVALDDIECILGFRADEPALYRSTRQLARITMEQLKHPQPYRCPGL